MARTKKSRGGSPFELKSGNSPHKFIGGLVKNVLGGIGNKLAGSRLFGGSGGNAAESKYNPVTMQMEGGNSNTSIGKFVGMGSGGNINPTQAALNAQQNVPLTKKKTKFKKK